jgi:hypothetical protein
VGIGEEHVHVQGGTDLHAHPTGIAAVLHGVGTNEGVAFGVGVAARLSFDPSPHPATNAASRSPRTATAGRFRGIAARIGRVGGECNERSPL